MCGEIQKGVEHVERNRRRDAGTRGSAGVSHSGRIRAPPAWDQARDQARASSDRREAASWSRGERFVDAGFVRRFSLTVPLLRLTLSRGTLRWLRQSAGSPHSACAPSKVKCPRLEV